MLNVNTTKRSCLLLAFCALWVLVTSFRTGDNPPQAPVPSNVSSPVWTLKRELKYPWEHLFSASDLQEKLKDSPFAHPPSFVTNTSRPEFSHVPHSRILPAHQRLLADQNILDSPGIIGFDKQDTTAHEYYAYQYIFTNLKMYASSMVIYPYAFSFKQNDSDATSTVDFTKGAVFTTKPSSLPDDPSTYNYFVSLAAATNVSFGKAKALYDINVGVLSISGYYDDTLMELTYESSYYCNILSTYLGKYTDCLTADEYAEFKADTSNAGKTALVMLDESAIATDDLLFTPDGGLRFQILVLPDYYLGAHEAITTKLGTTGVQKIKTYLSKGGLIYATGKGGYLLEHWGVLPTGLYNTNLQLTSTDSNLAVKLEGCDPSNTDFMASLLCLNLQDASSNTYSYLLNAFLMNSDKAQGLTTYMSYVKDSPTLKKSDLDGLVSGLTDEEKSFLPFVMSTKVDKGRVLLVNGNPLYKSGYAKVFYNHLMLAMSKNVMLDSYVGSSDGKPIPGGEAGVRLNLRLSFVNLYDVPANDVQLHVWFPNNISAQSYPADCDLDTSDQAVMDLSAVNISSHIKCARTAVAAFERFEVTMNLEILDYLATKDKYDVLIVAPMVAYTDTETTIAYKYDIGGIRTDAALAAYLAGGVQVDPSAFYPVKGTGNYVDNVFGVENKEDTCGIDVDYVAVVPLISPIVDGNDQRNVAQACRFFYRYYNDRTPQYTFPFESTTGKNFDFLDFKWLTGKNVVLSADWDTPTKAGKLARNSSFPDVTTSVTVPDVINANWSTIIDNVNIVLKQIYFKDADRFFELATQRLLAFINTATDTGAAAHYPNGIPDGEVNPGHPTRTRKEMVWARLDLFFYQSDEYVKPTGIGHTHVMSIDRYPKDSSTCVNTFGDSVSKVVVGGYFGNSYENGLKENEYSNAMLNYCNMAKVELSEVEELSNGTVLPIHYLVPVTDDEIQSADDLMYFVTNSDGTGYLTDYPELRFIYAHGFSAKTPAGLGGKLEITLPANAHFIDEATKDPVEERWITYSSGMAFYKTIYDSSAGLITAYFRYGGHASNVSKPSSVSIVLENINTVNDAYASVKAYEMKFDISQPELNYEVYILRSTETVNMVRDRYYSLPGVEIHSKLNRSSNTSIFPYESIDTYSSIGLYIQELQRHRTVYASAESHHVTDPGMQTISGGLSMISNLGVSSIPFADLVTHGSGLLIPNAPTTSRLEWYDIWGRHWVNPLASLFPDIPPVPAPLLRFAMTSTYELTKTGSTERVLEWNSEEELDILVKIKLHNTYPKFFSITNCKDNEVTYIQDTELPYARFRIHDPPAYPYEITWKDAPTSSYQINYGNRAVYGICYDAAGTILKGGLVSETNRQRIATAYLCAATLDQDALLACSEELADLPTVTKRTDSGESTWIYSPDVDPYYPANYIKADMWDMTHKYYDDTPMNKAFAYHLDNNLPGIEFGPGWNPSRYKPHNIIAFPVWKGFGFDIWYDKTKGVKRYPKFTGWWSDNLQNRDNTLYAGQSSSNDISVNSKPLIDDDDWINARDIINPLNPTLATGRLKNVHTCLFNQHRIRLNVNHTIGAYIHNVYQNNIIPIKPDLTNNDYYNYDCDGIYQYSPTNISQFDSIVRTNDIRDSMLFAANLRGEAYETINIVMGLKPRSSVKYEGMAKVHDGGSFSYWNPVNGPNSFESCGSTLNAVIAKRNDLTITCEVLPKTTTTFNPVLYHLITIKDPAEDMREWTYVTYTSNYGFGDSTTSIFVGGPQATKATLSPGEYTIIKVSFFNNAGFDWNLLYGAVDAEEIGNLALNAGDMMSKAKHTIQKPTSYNFMILSIPEEIKNYITIVPSDHNLDISPMVFDFTDINIMTIKDGYSSRFFYKLTISSDFPDNLTGKVYEIGITLDEKYFDKLPGYNDPTGTFHDYKLKVPSFKFGVPYTTGVHKGKVYYTSGYSTKLNVTATLPSYWNVTEARLIDDHQLLDLRTAASDADNYKPLMEAFWDTLESGTVALTNKSTATTNTITLDFSKAYPAFPKPNGTQPDIATFYALLKVNTSQLSYGTTKVISSPTVKYLDFANKSKSSVVSAPTDKTVNVKGAWIKVSYTSKIVVKNETTGAYDVAADQRLFQNDANFVVRVMLTAKNVGTDTAYRANFTSTFDEGIKLIEDTMRSDLGYTLTTVDGIQTLKMNTMVSFAPGTSHSELIYLMYSASDTRRRLLTATTSRTFINSVRADIDLTGTVGADQVSQSIETPLKYSIICSDRETVTLTGEVDNSTGFPIIHLTATAVPAKTSAGQDVRYIFYYRITEIDCTSNTDDPYGDCGIFNTSEVVLRTLSSVQTADSSPIPDTFSGYLATLKIEYRVETYSETKLMLAKSQWGTAFPDSDSDPKGKLPLWAIILIPSLAVIVIIFAAVIILRRLRSRVKVHNATSPTLDQIKS